MNPSILTLHKLSPLVPLIASFWLIHIIQAHRLESSARNGLLVYVGSMGCWAFGSLLMRNSENIAEAMIWAKLMWAAGVFMGASMLHFVYDLLGLRQRRLVYVLYAFSFSVAVVSLTTRLAVAAIEENEWGYLGTGGPFRHLVSASYLFFFAYSFILLFRYRYSRGAAMYHAVNVMLIAFTVEALGVTADILPTVGIRLYPAGMFTHTVFVVLIAHGAFRHQLAGVLSRPQPRLVLASLTYALIASGIALTFTASPSKYVFVFLLGLLFLAFNSYHFYDDISYLTSKYLRIRRESFLYKTMDDSSILFDDADVGIVVLDRQKEVLFSNRKAARILGREVIQKRSLSCLRNDILRQKLVKYSDHGREIIIDVDADTSAEIIPVELGGYVGTLICFYPKSKRHILERAKRSPRMKRLNFWDIFSEK